MAFEAEEAFVTSRTRLAASSIAVGVLVLLLKFVAWRVTGSAALYSDALESIVNVAASAVALAALRFAARPADANHTYGHEKAEFFAAVLEGAMIVVAAAAILAEARATWTHPHPIDAPWRGLAVNGVATGLNAAWGVTLLRTGRRLRSPVLAADGRHLLADVVTSLGVACGLALAVFVDTRFDPLVAAGVAVNVLVQGYLVMRSSIGGLMDEAPPDTIEQVRALVGDSAAGAIEAHDLRVRQSGRHTFLEFHLVVPGAMSVKEAHDICDRVEAALHVAMQDVVVTIHVEPEGKAKHHGVLVL